MGRDSQMLIGDLPIHSARRYPNKDAAVYQGKHLTFRQFNERVNRCANALLGLGLKRGDKVAILSRNRPEMLEVCFAAAKLGIWYVPLNFRLKAAELEFVVNDAGVKVFIASDRFADVVEPVRPNLQVEHFYSLEEGYEGLLAGADPEEPEAAEAVSPNDPFALFYTSGTTGNPKGVLLTHANFMAAAMNHIIAYEMTPASVCLHYMPLYHTMEASLAICLFYVGGTNVVVENFSAEGFWDTVRDEGVTISAMVPTMIIQILDEFEKGGREVGTLKTLSGGGQAVPVQLVKRSMRLLGPRVLFIVYGLTEASPLLTYLPRHEMVLEGPESKRLGSIGKEMFNCHLRVVGPNDVDVRPGEIGEIIAQGPNVMAGYYQRPEETEKTLEGGWLRSGDLATVDEDGYIYILDRKKDIIISGGENITPREVEEVLYRHPAVSECAVIGVPDDLWGEQVKAVIVLRSGAVVDEVAIIKHCRQDLAHYKCPRTVSFVDAIPKDPAGKIQRKQLREQFGKGAR
jgi:acyl-CoA synthetase (AMP-forming)/AMP-acid ligase II